MSSQPIFLKLTDVVDIDGRKFTAEELKEHVIDSILYRKHLEELQASQ